MIDIMLFAIGSTVLQRTVLQRLGLRVGPYVRKRAAVKGIAPVNVAAGLA